MKKRLTLLGCTGSIGESTLDVVAREVAAWEHERNWAAAGVTWRFTIGGVPQTGSSLSTSRMITVSVH